MSKAGNWRDTDESYWIGVAEGMEAAAKICDRRSNELHPKLEQRIATYGRAALAIREAIVTPARARWGDSDPNVCVCGHDLDEHDGGGPDDPHHPTCEHPRCKCQGWRPEARKIVFPSGTARSAVRAGGV